LQLPDLEASINNLSNEKIDQKRHMESIEKELTVLENQISRFEAEMTPEHEKLMKIHTSSQNLDIRKKTNLDIFRIETTGIMRTIILHATALMRAAVR
jgi:predicted  nucleic acid-binding Zn-ribbon protein